MLTTILKNNINLFGESPKVEKINIGFTNTVYKINDSFILKICTDITNEEDFLKEIEFYKANKSNTLIPKLYFFSVDKKEIPYMYEIIEKIEGVSLYNVWHTFSEEERENIIKQLCLAMKEFHNNSGPGYDWSNYFKNQFIELFNEAKRLNIFNVEEIKELDLSFLKFDKYLDSNEFVLVHNDLHFDNIFYHDGNIKLIDFERSMYAPNDFELDILYRMIRKPWKFASEETEKYTNIDDYSNIMSYVEKYYPELISIPNLYKRLAIYDIIYFLEQYVNRPDIEELKVDVLNAVKILNES